MIRGKRVLVTRPKGQASSFCEGLERVGAIPVLMPAIEIAPPSDTSALDGAIRSLDRFDWVIFTSANGVRAFADRMSKLGVTPNALSLRRLAAVGPVTARALADSFRGPDVVPGEFVSSAIASVLGDVSGMSILLAQAEIASDELPQDLKAKGAAVTCVAAYRSAPAGSDVPIEQPHYITFASSSAVHSTVNQLRAAGCENWLSTAPIVCIGPVTAGSVSELGYPVAAVAGDHTAEGMIKALLQLTEMEPQRV